MGWCSECEADTRVVTPEEAALLSRVSSRTIYRWIETDRIHFSETAGGLLLICLNSLLATTREGGTPCQA
jgi:excisionase family DNA binding protein